VPVGGESLLELGGGASRGPSAAPAASAAPTASTKRCKVGVTTRASCPISSALAYPASASGEPTKWAALGLAHKPYDIAVQDTNMR